MRPRTLIGWARLEDSRRAEHHSGFQALPHWALSIILGTLLAAEIARRLLMASPAEFSLALVSASHFWLAAAVSGYLIGVFGASFRLYWRQDSKILASLPVPGRSLFALAIWRSHQSACNTSIALGVGLVALGALGEWSVAFRHLAPLAIGFAGVAWLGPAAALAAGAIVASDKTQAVIASMGGEFQAPKTTWLSALPGFAATVVAVAIIACAPWIVGERPAGGSIVFVLSLGIVPGLLALGWSWTRADLVVPAAIREVAALDQEILAHIERSSPSIMERVFFSRWLAASNALGVKGALLLATKDASLSRRRYPSPYFLLPCGIFGVWIVALSEPAAYLAWGGAIVSTLLAYTVVMARRLYAAPIEIGSLLRSLAVSREEATASKRAAAFLRVAHVVVLSGVPLLLRSPDVVATGIFLSMATGLTLLATRYWCPRL